MSLRPTEADRSTRRGFVLIEVLVAVGVAAIVLAALLRSFSATWAGINVVREEAESMLLARTLLAEGGRSNKILPGTQNGTLGRYGWSLTALPVPVAPPQPSPQPQSQLQSQTQSQSQPAQSGDEPATRSWTLYRVTVVLTTPSGRSKSLETFRLGPAPK